MTEKSESQDRVPIKGETDRLYQSVDMETQVRILEDGQPRFEIRRDALNDVVVWNPGPDAAKGMSDFGPADGWKRMRMLMSFNS